MNRSSRALVWASLLGVGLSTFAFSQRPRFSIEQMNADRMRKTARAILTYAQDYDETFPPMIKTEEMQDRLLPYAHEASNLRSLITGKFYRLNPALPGHPISEWGEINRVTALTDTAAGNRPYQALLGGEVRQGERVIPEDLTRAPLRRAQLLSTAFWMYAQDYDEQLPNILVSPQIDNAILPYTRDRSVFWVGASNRPWVYNTALAGFSLGAFEGDWSSIPVFGSDSLTPNDTNLVAFLSGDIRWHGITFTLRDYWGQLNARSLSFAVYDYTRDHSDQLPTLKDPVKLAAQLKPYLSGRVYLGAVQFNAALSDRVLTHSPKEAFTVLFSAPRPDPDGTTITAFADFRVDNL